MLDSIVDLKKPDRITIDPAAPPGQPLIRDTQIKFWQVYRDLVFHGLTDAEVLQNHAGLEPEDIPAVHEYALHLIKSRTHDEFTGRRILPRDQLMHGKYYKGRCRHTTVARWNAEEECFYHWREKMGFVYVAEINYPTDSFEPWWDVFDVVEELSDPRFEIPFDADAVFDGDPEILNEFNAEMWAKPKRA